MSIHVALHHRTHYTYDRPVAHSPHIVRLRPAPHSRTPILAYSLRILPKDHFINWQQDAFANHAARIVFPSKSTELLVEVDLVAEMSVYNPFDFFLEDSAQEAPFAYDAALKKDLAPYMTWPGAGPRLLAMIDAWRVRRMRTIDFLVEINRHVQQAVKYLIRLEPGVQTPEETLGLKSGSCRDSGWLLVQLLRGLGFATRFVSGYLIQLKPDVKSLDGPSGADSDFTDLHAWCEVYLPGAGWIGLDPTSGLMAGEGHIPLSCTPEPQGAAAVTGAVDPCESVLVHEMRVTRIHESPRVTKPYTREQWERIEVLGRRIDADLVAGDVRLTMGGEPTFVSIDDREGEEWSTAAVGPTKRVLSGELLRRLRAKFAPGGLLYHGQGKWYPGEALPRWALGCFWRKDGVPVWEDESLIADERKNYGHGAVEAEKFAARFAENAGVEKRWILPAYEDVYYYLWKERRLPANVDPLQSKLENPGERARLARLFQTGLGSVVGYVLPFARGSGDWRSGPWFLRDETLWLLPGDSPIGYRLPLDSIPWVSAGDYPYVNHPDPMQPQAPLPPRTSPVSFQARGGPASSVDPKTGRLGAAGRGPKGGNAGGAGTDGDTARPEAQQSASWILRTAMCFEPREGRLHVFFPPVTSLEDYLELVSVVERTSRELAIPVVLEGTPPPFDPRLNVLKVTPDPGVIEVNLHPAHSWDELVANTRTTYEEARQTRLGTEKFMVDGRHTGTGGGNHIVIGGATPADSPLLRRPDLLRSLLAYWQNHPSLSYLFSGLFIGPTSQHPRVDEARNDALHELELAFRQVPTQGWVPPWLVDRLFRNLLVDVTGNTHRTEFSIDKLYSPDSATGRLGLVELRSFEMPPHAEMSLAQHLLLRAAIARFWKQPYEHHLVRWGTQLHDRFLLPHFVWQDFEDVVEDMREHGYPLETSWFDPHFEFRFPRIGDFTRRAVQVELRNALEPWHVLGEEGGGGG
ncbi:MAG: transglutaminase family protein, partial [Verrucomicrobia bacterium]